MDNYFKSNQLAQDVWKSKYALKDLSGEVVEQSPEDMHKRMSKEFARISQSYGWDNSKEGLSDYGKSKDVLDEEEVFSLFDKFKHIIPQGSIMSGLGDTFRYKSLSNCLGGNTKVLTQNGLQKISNLSGSTHSILTKGGHWVEAPFKCYGKQKLWKIRLSRGKSNTKTIYATKDHRWFTQKYGKVYEETLTENLSKGDKLKLTFGKNRGNLKPSQFGISHGIVFGDGHTVNGVKNSNNITLCSDSRKLGKYMIADPISSNESLCEGGSDFYSGIPNYFRKTPDLNENHQYLYGWLAGYFAADGHIDSGGTAFIDSAEKEHVEFVQDVCAVLGIGCGDIKKSNVISNLTNESHTMYRLTLFTQQLSKDFFILDKHLKRYNKNKKNVFRWKVDEVKETNKIEKVYCAEVPKTESFVIEGNILTGNCVVLKDVVDSYGGIMYSDQQLAQLMKRRCGVGIDISKLRPRGTVTKNAAKTSTGAVSFLKRFSDTTNEVAQEGRRGALMVTLDCRHPDVMEFIESKDASDKITGANISVKWTKDFIDAVKNEEKYTLRWPVDSSVEEAEITKIVDAKEVFTQAAMYAHGYDQSEETNAAGFGGDPGCMFIDRMIEYSTDCGYPGITVLSTNPCQPGYSTLRTPDGLKKMKDIEVGDIVWSEDEWVNVINKVETGVKSVYKYKTTAGTFHSTKDHRVKQHEEKIEINNADEIDLLQGPQYNKDVNLNQQSVLDGLMIGDGNYHQQSYDSFYLNVGENDQDYFDDPVSELIHESHPVHHDRANKVTTTLDKVHVCNLWDREVPEKYFYGHTIDVRSFLRGLYSANGSICGKRVTLKTTSPVLVNQVQEMLSSIGIRSYFTTNKPTITKHKNGEYQSRESYDINITSDREVFYNSIGFIQDYKMNKLKDIIEDTNSRNYRKSHQIIDVEYVGDLPVYDITVDGKSHTYWTHGFNSSNCGEIGMHNDCCRLIALNFMSAIENPFQDDAHINITKLYKIAYEQQVLLDNLVDLEIEAIDRIIEKVKSDSEDDKYKSIELETWNDLRDSAIEVRRTGGGFTALGDALAALGVEYGSEEGNQVVEELMKVKFKGEWDASIDLAIQRGSFPKWDSQYDSTKFFDMMKEEFPNIYKRNNKYGRRNISLSTVAPTGSVSLLANINGYYGTTSGIEPVFSTEPNVLWHTRRKKAQDNDEVVEVDENGIEWTDYKVFHEGFRQWLLQNVGKSVDWPNVSEDILKEWSRKSPYVTSAELDYKQRIKVQSIVQKYTTHSISSTLNLPQDAHWSTTEDIYMKGYDAGLKGVTIFRDGSKRGVLESSDNSSDNNSIVYNDAPKRPEVLEADVHIVRNSWAIVVGKLDDKPYELFTIYGPHFCDNDWEEVKEEIYNQESFTLKKKRSKHYSLMGNNKGLILGNVLDWSPSNDTDVLTRFVSMLMRHGVKMDYIVQQVEKADISINDFSNVVNSVLRQYTTEEYTSTVDCDKCNGENVHYVEGCLVCKECGMSKCG